MFVQAKKVLIEWWSLKRGVFAEGDHCTTNTLLTKQLQLSWWNLILNAWDFPFVPGHKIPKHLTISSDFNMNELQSSIGMDLVGLGDPSDNHTGMDSDDLVPSLQVLTLLTSYSGYKY